MKVPEGSLFALGDNWGNSGSKSFYGLVPENLKGEAFCSKPTKGDL